MISTLAEPKLSGQDKPVVQCLLCGSDSVHVVDQFSFSELRQLYFETCEVDITTCLDLPYEDLLVCLYRCGDCRLEFYPNCLQGNAKLYEAMGKFDYYYVAEKWEFRVALEVMQHSMDIMELGCGTGLFLDQARRAYPEKRFTGLELNPEAARISRQKGHDVQLRSVEDFSVSHAGCFDYVCAFQLLEHMANPRSFLESAFRCLREGGLCVLTVPNAGGFIQYAVNDFGNMPPHHITRWTADMAPGVAQRFHAKVERILEEPVADYHRQWYRDTLLIKAMSTALGLKWKRVERGTAYRMMLALSRVLQRAIPSPLWRYRRYPGHTLYIAFRKES